MANPPDLIPASVKTIISTYKASIEAGDAAGMIGVIAEPFTLIEDEFTLVMNTKFDALRLANFILAALGKVDKFDIEIGEVRPFGAGLLSVRCTVQLTFEQHGMLDKSQIAFMVCPRNGTYSVLMAACLLKNLTDFLREEGISIPLTDIVKGVQHAQN